MRVAASSLATDALAVHDRRDVLVFAAAKLSADRALQQAGLAHEQIDVAELYDRFSVYAALSLEACGFARRGEGWQLARNGAIGRAGGLPISTFGGLKARGNPGGATGVYQLVEVARQLAGMAGENQVAGAKWGLAQCLGSSGGTAVTHILQGIESS
jgi:acetyl-CoA C-acetyltransferase